MIGQRKLKESRIRRVKRCKRKYALKGRIRLVIRRSSKHIYGQLVDDEKGICITGASSLTPEIRQKSAGLTKSAVASLVGELIATKAKEKGIDKIVFDRHGYKYQGRLKSLAEGARKGGINF